MITPPRTRRRRRVTAVALGSVIALVYGLVFYAVVITPDYRTTLLVDTSVGPSADASVDAFDGITAAAASAAQNTAGTDSLSLRRFGGQCGDPRNTAEIVGAGTDHGQQVADAARGLSAGGDATLLSGILAAIDDYSGLYPFRANRSNRIIVVTTHGVDACTDDQAEISRTIRDRIAAAELELDLRFVGYLVPADQRDSLARVASATSAPAPTFVDDPTVLTETLKEFTLQEPPRARPVDPPDTTTSTPEPPQQALVHVIVTGTQWDITITTDPPGTTPCTHPPGFDAKTCEFLVPAGTRMRLRADISGSLPGPDPFDRAFNGAPAWFGCDESPSEPRPFNPDEDWTVGETTNTFRNATQTCTLALDTGRAVCLGTTDLNDGGATAACANVWSENPRIHIPLGTTTLGSTLPTGSTTGATDPAEEVVMRVRIYGSIVTVSAGGTECGPNTAPHGPPLCRLVLPAGGTADIQAVPVRGVAISPVWYGCDEPAGSAVCSVSLTGNRNLCVDSGEGESPSPCLDETVGPEPTR
jgi:hypothetical protein